MGAGGYESWFVSARDPASRRALWIRHTRHRPVQGPESAALWCTVIDRDQAQPPTAVKQVFGTFPPDAAAGPRQFRGQAADFGTAPPAWLELILARIRVGPARSPWTAMGALSLGGEPMMLGGLGRRPRVQARPDRLTAEVPSARARLQVTVTTDDDDAVAVPYRDPAGGTRTVRHAALAAVELTLRRPGQRELTLSGRRGAYEYGTSQGPPGVVPQPLPEG